MPYVMVPVPEEHVAEIMEHVVRLAARANQQQWDAEAVAELFLGSDEASKSVLSTVARRTIAGSPLTDDALADLVQLTRRETLGVIRELNVRATRTKRSQLMIVKDVDDGTAEGRTGERRVVGMSVELAEMIRKAEELERAATPHPLQRNSG
jgi:hypothetical protein